VFEAPPYAMKGPSGEWRGLTVDLWKEIAGDLGATIEKCLADGTQNLFFLGSGGAGILMQPAAALLQAQSAFPAFASWPAEFIRIGSRNLGPQSVVIIPSLSGTTAESIEALAYCKRAGATVITLTGYSDTPLGQGAVVTLTFLAKGSGQSTLTISKGGARDPAMQAMPVAGAVATVTVQ